MRPHLGKPALLQQGLNREVASYIGACPDPSTQGMKGEGKAHRRFLPFKLVHRILLYTFSIYSSYFYNE